MSGVLDISVEYSHRRRRPRGLQPQVPVLESVDRPFLGISFRHHAQDSTTIGRRSAPMSLDMSEIGTVPAAWTRHHLLGLEDLTAEEITLILDTAVMFKEATAGCRHKLSVLAGRTLANLFFENSTRTKTSFALAARRLGADTVDFSSSGSSLSKGETFIDTAKNIEAMGIDAVVVRHRTPGTPHLLAQNLNCSVINAGDGPHEHPTQGLLDILTIREQRGRIEGLTVALVGDIAHSRTGARISGDSRSSERT